MRKFLSVHRDGAIAEAVNSAEHNAGEPEALFARTLGCQWRALPMQLQRMHTVNGSKIAEGRARVERGSSLTARLAAAIVGLPAAADDVPVRVRLKALGGGEIWHRTFGSRHFRSRLEQHISRASGLVTERFGLLVVTLQLTWSDDRLWFHPRGASICGIALPRRLCPSGASCEFVDQQGRFSFDVAIAVPWCGLIVRYQGYLLPIATTDGADGFHFHADPERSHGRELP